MYAWMTEDLDGQVARYRNIGVNMVTVGARELLMHGARSFLERSHKALSQA